MDTNQLTQIRGFLKVISEFGIDSKVASFYKSFGDLTTVKVGRYNIIELTQRLKQVIENFIYVFDNQNHEFLPFQYNFQNEFGAGNLVNDLSAISTNLATNQYQNIPGIVDRLIYYQIENNIWKIPHTRKVSQKDTKKLVQELNLIEQHLKEQRTILKDLLNKGNAGIESFEALRQQKLKELQEISNNLQLTRNQTNEISNLLHNSTANNEKINSLVHQQDQKLTEMSKRNEAEKKSYKDHIQTITGYEENLSDLIKKTEQQYSDFEAKLKFIEDKKVYFEERNSYLDELIGREVGASLFETFRQRKNELKKPVNFWKWAVPVMSVATVVWIFILFKGHTEIKELEDWWKFFGINTLKSIPPIFLMIFSISQYKKERNFQEEYAFKSAVALTIDAFSKRITSPESKDDLILKSVLEVYKSPMYFTKDEKDDKPSRQILDSIKNMTETVKDFVKK